MSPEWAAEIKRVYNNDLEMVDTMVGLMAEPLPEGMGFSDTAFRIFLLMASRRLKSDRFLSQDYRPEIYTKEGIEWVEENSMNDVISRHFPSVAFAMKGLDDETPSSPGSPSRSRAETQGCSVEARRPVCRATRTALWPRHRANSSGWLNADRGQNSEKFAPENLYPAKT